jgi:hypothetical protein
MHPDDPQTAERRALGLMIFAALSALVVVALLIAFLTAALNSLNSNRPTSPRSAGPYNTLTRPLPQVESAEALFPAQLGTFRRTALRGTLSSLTAAYQSGDGQAQIAIRAGREVSNAAAQARVRLVERTIGVASIDQLLNDADPSASYFFSAVAGGLRFAWSRSAWHFDVQAPSRESLDAFMNSFQY